MRHYYQIFDDMGDEAIWTLQIPLAQPNTSFDPWGLRHAQFCECPPPVFVRVFQPGATMDFNTSLDVPIVARRMASVIEEMASADIQRIPADLDHDGNWEIINILHAVDCLDEQHSVIDWYPPDDPRSGRPRGVRRLVLQAGPLDGFHICRIARWSGPIVVSDTLADRLVTERFTGFTLTPIETTR